MKYLFPLVLPVLAPTAVDACGGFFCEPARPVVQSGEAIVFGVNGNKVTMHVQILYEGPAEAFSWVLPLPLQPDEIRVGSDLLFSALFQQTLPQWELQILENSDSCSPDALEEVQCMGRESFFEDGPMVDEAAMEEDGAVVLEEGSVGPFDFVVLEAAENNPSSVLEWLNDNGYDQPEGSGPLLNYYAVNNHVFVALRLQKEAETGEIQPLILEYTMPTPESATQVSRRAMACVPIQLTSIAATDNMPIQVYILGPARAVPLNFVELELDDTHVDWLLCQNNPGCFDDDYRLRFDRAASQLVNHSFVTEFAGPSFELLNNTIAIDVTLEEIASVENADEFFETVRFRLPQLPLIDTIVDGFLDGSTFDAAALAAELEEKVLEPARQSQAFVDGFPYLTRMYARLSPEYMTKDPFFAFKPELPNVDRVHRATASPICTDNIPSALTITVDSGRSMVVRATTMCGGWSSTEAFIWNASQSPAVQLVSWGFEGDPGVVVTRLEDGSFDRQAIAVAVEFGDSLVMNQTIPEYSTTAIVSDDNPEGNPPAETNNPDASSPSESPNGDPAAVESSSRPLLLSVQFTTLTCIIAFSFARL